MPASARVTAPRVAAPSRPKAESRLSNVFWSFPPARRSLYWHPSFAHRKANTAICSKTCKSKVSPARVDGRVVRLSDDLKLDRQMRHQIEVVVDRLIAGPDAHPRLAEAVELALRLGNGEMIVATESSATKSEIGTRKSDGATRKPKRAKSVSDVRAPTSDLVLSAHYACTHCGTSFEPPSPQLFSFNSPQGMCPKCDGLGEIYGFDVARLVPNPDLSFAEGAIEIVGAWRNMGRVAPAHLSRRGRHNRAAPRFIARHHARNSMAQARSQITEFVAARHG